ncbi:MAG: hypothetical protein AB1938_13325 [Myxococcota bacterium]
MERYAVKAIVLQSLVTTLKQRGHFDKVRAKAAPACRALLDAPGSEAAHDGETVDALYACVLEVVGADELVALSTEQVSGPLGRVIGGFLRVLLSASGAGPASIFSRMQTFVNLAMKGVTVRYEESSLTDGQMTFEYPAPHSAAYFHSWKGALLHVFDLTRTQGQIEDLVGAYPSKWVRMRLAWRPVS